MARVAGRLAHGSPGHCGIQVAGHTWTPSRTAGDSVRSELEVAGKVFEPRARIAAAFPPWNRSPRGVPHLVPAFPPVMRPSNALVMQLNARRAHRAPDADALAHSTPVAARKLTTEMTFALADAAARIRADAPSFGWVVTTPPAQLTDDHRHGGLPRVADEAVSEFLARYGTRGVVEIDVGGPRWNEDATGVWDSIASYLRVDDFSQWPQARYQRGWLRPRRP